MSRVAIKKWSGRPLVGRDGHLTSPAAKAPQGAFFFGKNSVQSLVMPEKMLIGLSGGVDSALSAALLVEAGHEVHGVYLKAWSEADILPMTACPWKDDIADARRVAAHLGIPFTVIDVHEAYRKRVVDVMLAEYAAGRTPNPDILCNREMKFGLLLDLARDLGYDAVATGHYARVHSEELVGSHRDDLSLATHYALHRAGDEKKDQTYFLWTLTQGQLAMVRFPIGHLRKDEVRAEAARRNLPVATKKDSQGICFLGPVDVQDFLRATLKPEPGNTLDCGGRIVGTHQGAALATIGQRYNGSLTTTSPYAKTLYVVAKGIERNELVVDADPPTSSELAATELNWIGLVPEVGMQLEARIRHGQLPQPALITSIAHHPSLITLRFAQPQTAVASGQSVVFSNGSTILGGGVIV